MNISEYIKQDLKSQIKSNHELRCRLTLNDLADYYSVSATPVRAAVKDLIAEKYLYRKSNGRLAVALPHLHSDPLPESLEKPSPPTNWREVITQDIIRHSMHNENGFLREEATASKYGVSRTVIRQVFSRLVGKGILEHVPRSGWRIRKFDEADMIAYLTVRETLELKALELARGHLERADLDSMLAGNPRQQLPDSVQLDNRIHDYLVKKSGNFYIQDFFERHGMYYMMMFEQAALEASVVAEMAEQHRKILSALLNEEWSNASNALSEHIRSQKPIMEKLMASLEAQE